MRGLVPPLLMPDMARSFPQGAHRRHLRRRCRRRMRPRLRSLRQWALTARARPPRCSSAAACRRPWTPCVRNG